MPDDPWAVVSTKPASTPPVSTSADDPWAVVSHQPAPPPNDSVVGGFFRRGLDSLKSAVTSGLPYITADEIKEVAANPTLGNKLKLFAHATPGIAPISRMIEGQVGAEKQAVPQIKEQLKAAKDVPSGNADIKALSYARAGTTALSTLNPFATGSVTNVNQLEDQGRNKEAIGQGGFDALALASGTKPGQAILGKVGALAGGEKSVPRSALSRTIKPENPVEFHAAEQSAIPKVNAAAQDLGHPIKTADDAIAAIRQAKQNALLDAHEAAGPGKTIADLPPEQLKALQDDMGALDTLDKHIKTAQEAAAETKPQPTRTEAAGQILKGGAKVAAGAAVDAVAPGLGHAASLLGLFKGTPEVVSGVKNLLAKRALTAENLDLAVQQTFGKGDIAPRTQMPQPEAPAQSTPYYGDLSVQHETNIAPPRQPHGDAAITPDEEPAPPEQTKPPYEPYAGDRTVVGTGTEPPAPKPQPFKATTPEGQTAEVLKKAGIQQALKEAGVAAPSATVRGIRPGIDVGPILKPRMDLTFFGDKTGEGASLMQLTKYNINELRAMAVQRGLDVAPGEGHIALIEKIHDDLSPAEIKEFSDAAAERGRFSPPAKTKRGTQPAAQPQAAAEEPPDRRSNLDLREAINKMSPEDQVKAIYQSAKTDLPNKRAFDWAENTRGPAKVIGMSDADGLKAMNDKHGYAAGDALLKAKADALKEAGLEAYHDKGDEFMFRGDSPEDMAAKLDKAKDILQNKVIEFKDSQGNVRHFSGAQFSYGTGSDLASAEAALKLNKSGRKASGAAAGRGEMGGLKEVKP